MEQLTTPATMRAWSEARRAAGHRLAFVPTMGALHAGHRRLIDVAHSHGDVVIVSIFVNRLQFNRQDDFAAYPRPIDDDATTCADAGVDALYAPTATAMYPPEFQTHVEPGPLADPMEGAGRPGHFRGVATVVAKLLNATAPHVAVFGQKDYQQLAVVRRMVADLDMGVEIVSVPTVREPDGLALSSRNRRLSAAARAAAVVVPTALNAALERFEEGERDAAAIERTVETTVGGEAEARLEYAQVVNARTLQRHEQIVEPSVLATAVWFDDVRLIDNVLLDPSSR